MAQLTDVKVTVAVLWVDFVELDISLELPEEEVEEFNTYFLTNIKQYIIEDEQLLEALTNVIAVKCFDAWVDVSKEKLSKEDSEIVNRITSEVWQSISITSIV